MKHKPRMHRSDFKSVFWDGAFHKSTGSWIRQMHFHSLNMVNGWCAKSLPQHISRSLIQHTTEPQLKPDRTGLIVIYRLPSLSEKEEQINTQSTWTEITHTHTHTPFLLFIYSSAVPLCVCAMPCAFVVLAHAHLIMLIHDSVQDPAYLYFYFVLRHLLPHWVCRASERFLCCLYRMSCTAHHINTVMLISYFHSHAHSLYKQERET